MGVLIGIGGHPYVAEMFDSPIRLRAQLTDMLEAAALDARLAPQMETPSRRARRFIERLDHVRFEHTEPAGIAERATGTTECADVATLRWQDHAVHSRMTNVRHPMLMA